jgi:hypothetical protein
MVSQLEELEPFSYPGTDNVRLSPANGTRRTVETNCAFVLSPSMAFSFENRPMPKLQTLRHVRIRVVATGLCGSDVRANVRTLSSSAGRNCLCALVVANLRTRFIISNTDAFADTLSKSRSSWATSLQASSKSVDKMSKTSRWASVWRSSLV